MEYLILWASLIIAIIAIVRTNSNARSIEELKQMIATLRAGTTPHHSSEPLSQSGQAPSQVPSFSSENTDKNAEVAHNLGAVVDTAKKDGFIEWLQRDWLIKLGGVLVITGLLFFLSVAFESMGPQGKVMTGYVIGIGLMIFGFYWAKKYVNGGTGINLIGAIVVIFTTFTARTPAYDILDPYMALALIFVTSAFVALVALVYQKSSVAHVGLVMASIAPLLIQPVQQNFSGDLLYLLVVTIGVLWIVALTKWRTLIFLSQVIVLFYSLPLIIGFGASQLTTATYLYLCAFGFIFFATSIFSIIRTNGETVRVDGVIAVFNAVFAAAWIFTATPENLQSIAIAGVALAYMIGVFLVFTKTHDTKAFTVYSFVSVALLMIATVLELKENHVALVLAIVFEAGLATLFTRMLSSDDKASNVVALFNIFAIFGVLQALLGIHKVRGISGMGSENIEYYANQTALMGDKVTDNITISIIAIAFYFFIWGYLRKIGSGLANVFLAVNALFVVVFVWQFAHYALAYNVATFVSLIIYALAGLAVLFVGSQKGDDMMVKIGRGALVLVALRVLFVDAWSLGSTTAGVLTCIVIGLLLLSTTLITKK